jgi:hypothetical protein
MEGESSVCKRTAEPLSPVRGIHEDRSRLITTIDNDRKRRGTGKPLPLITLPYWLV